ncbi:MAG: TlpA disulfide reductase family protein [Kiritimatiellia bacterium]
MKSLGLTLALCALPLWLFGISGLTEENHISGPTYTEKDLKGRVIAVETWGFHCPPCRASLPHMGELAKKYAKDDRLVFIGAHWQGRNDEAIVQLLKENKCEYAVYQQFIVDGKITLPGGIPFAYVINHLGEPVYQGYPSSDFDNAIAAALKAMPKRVEGSLINGLELKFNKDIGKQLIIGKNIERPMKALEAKIAKGGEPAEEAKAILERCNEWIKTQTKHIDENLDTYSSKALTDLQLLIKTAPSAALSYKEQFQQLSQDAVIKRIATSRQMLEKLQKADASTKNRRKQLLSSVQMQIRQLSTITATTAAEDIKEAKACWEDFAKRLQDD